MRGRGGGGNFTYRTWRKGWGLKHTVCALACIPQALSSRVQLHRHMPPGACTCGAHASLGGCEGSEGRPMALAGADMGTQPRACHRMCVCVCVRVCVCVCACVCVRASEYGSEARCRHTSMLSRSTQHSMDYMHHTRGHARVQTDMHACKRTLTCTHPHTRHGPWPAAHTHVHAMALGLQHTPTYTPWPLACSTHPHTLHGPWPAARARFTPFKTSASTPPPFSQSLPV